MNFLDEAQQTKIWMKKPTKYEVIIMHMLQMEQGDKTSHVSVKQFYILPLNCFMSRKRTVFQYVFNKIENIYYISVTHASKT